MSAKDDNDRLQEGTLPHDPEEGTVPMAPPELADHPNPFDGAWKWFEGHGDLCVHPKNRAWLLREPHRSGLAIAGAGALPLGKAGMIAGTGGVGKTMLLCQLALAVAVDGEKWFGFEVESHGPVVLGLAEEDAEEIHRRLFNAAEALKLTREQREQAGKRILALPLAGKGIALTESDGGGNVDESANLKHMRHQLELEDVDWRLIILDPLSRWAGNDVEKDNHAATRFVQAVESLCKAPGGPTVLVAHHANKASRGTIAEERGVSGLRDGFRWCATVSREWFEREGTLFERVILHNTKTNYSKPFRTVSLTREHDLSGTLRRMTESEVENFEEMRALHMQEEKAKKAAPKVVKQALVEVVNGNNGSPTVEATQLEFEG